MPRGVSIRGGNYNSDMRYMSRLKESMANDPEVDPKWVREATEHLDRLILLLLQPKKKADNGHKSKSKDATQD